MVERSGSTRKVHPSPVRKILFLKLIEQGATVLAAPAIAAAVSRVGRDNVYFCVFRENRPILDLLDMVKAENVIELRHDDLATFSLDLSRALRRCRREDIDTVIDMEFFARAPAVIAYLSGARRRVGLHRFTDEGPYRGDLLTHRVAHNPYLHAAASYEVLLDALDLDPSALPLAKVAARTPPPAPRFVADDAERARVRDLLDEIAGQPVRGPLLMLNPNAGDLMPLRRWPTERFIELGRRLLEDVPTAWVLVTGAKSERDAADGVARAIGPRALNLAGRTTLRELLVLYTLADLLITNDSGPGHFASMTAVRSIVLFGPETPERFGPLGRESRTITARLACSPCVNVSNHRRSACSDNVCMQAIAVDTVLAEARRGLRDRGIGGAT
jgi:ADP-heptose:LPS heptosyltransferase